MKMSQCIRKGAKMGPQLIGSWGDGNGGSCVMGALLLGTGLFPKEFLEARQPLLGVGILKLYFEQEMKIEKHCPACGSLAPLGYLLIHINDVHEWTRERIAGWVEAHIETPVYSLLEMQEFMQIPEKAVSHVG